MAHRLRRALSLSFSLLNHPRYQPKPIPSISTHILSLAMSNPNPNSTVIHSSTQLTQSFTSTSTLFRKTFDPETDEIGPDTVLFEGCDYNHWLITMDFPKDSNLTREQMIETYINTAAQIFGSVEEAKKKIYALSTTTYQGFQVECSEETSEKFKNLPGVVFVLPDSYIDPVNKEYGGDKYVNGEIFPRPPPVHYGRRDNRDRRRRDNYGSPPQQNYGPPPQQQNNRPPPQQPNYGPPPQQPPNYGPPPQQPPNYGPPPQQPPNYGPPPQQPPNYGPPPQQPPNYGPPPQQPPNYRPPPQQQPNYGPPPQQQPNYGPPPQQQPNYGPPPQQQPNYGPPPPQPNYRPPPPQPNYGPPPQHQNYGPPPQQNYGPRPHQNYGPPPQQSYVRQPQQGFGNSPNSPLGQNSGPQESGDQRSFTPPSNAYQGKFDRAEPGKDYPEQRGFPQDATYESSVGGSFEHVPGAQRKF